MKYTLIGIIILVIIGIAGALFWFSGEQEGYERAPETGEPALEEGDNMDDASTEGAEAGEEEADDGVAPEEVIGSSAGGRDITAYHFGDGDAEVLFVGGIHGGYSWNTALLGWELIEYLREEPGAVPDGVMVTVVPVLNPDGLAEVVGAPDQPFTDADIVSTADTVAGRFNANDVDLNRNFACDWQTDGVWQSREVDGGSAAFSEPEAAAIEEYVAEHDIAGAVVWYSAAGGVYASNCHGGILPETRELMNVYADASEYPAFETFDYYEITGDMVNWLAKENVPAISVLLSTHDDAEWSKNRAGIEAALNFFAE